MLSAGSIKLKGIIMTPAELQRKLQQQREAVDSLRAYFSDFFPEEEFMYADLKPISDRQLKVWLRLYDNDVALIADAFEATSQKLNQLLGDGQQWDLESVIRFASGCMKRNRQIARGDFKFPPKAESGNFEVGAE